MEAFQEMPSESEPEQTDEEQTPEKHDELETGRASIHSVNEPGDTARGAATERQLGEAFTDRGPVDSEIPPSTFEIAEKESDVPAKKTCLGTPARKLVCAICVICCIVGVAAFIGLSAGTLYKESNEYYEEALGNACKGKHYMENVYEDLF